MTAWLCQWDLLQRCTWRTLQDFRHASMPGRAGAAQLPAESGTRLLRPRQRLPGPLARWWRGEAPRAEAAPRRPLVDAVLGTSRTGREAPPAACLWPHREGEPRELRHRDGRHTGRTARRRPADQVRRLPGPAVRFFRVSGCARIFVDQAAQDRFSMDPLAVEVGNRDAAT